MHGCGMGFNEISDNFWRYAGYINWAANNDIIVLFPQAKKGVGINFIGCWSPEWDFSGTYAEKTNDGIQGIALTKMINRILEDRADSFVSVLDNR